MSWPLAAGSALVLTKPVMLMMPPPTSRTQVSTAAFSSALKLQPFTLATTRMSY
jgi:hypothetical protein